MAVINPSDDWLTSKNAIKVYCDNASDYMFKKYVKAGMPARPEDGRWSASKKAIDEWWYLYNKINAAKIIDQIPDNGPGEESNNSMCTSPMPAKGH